jgi:16S rRNA (guanine966-N2)-methyltransferase
MRVISGAARGRSLRATADTRPTADLVKGAMFSMLEALAYKRGYEPDPDGNFAAAQAWPRVLDLFAGSGALGIEALSRGAQSADFLEQDRQAGRIIEANLRATGLAGQARVHVAPVLAGLGRLHGPYDVVFIDPPYAEHELLTQTVERIGASDLLTSHSVVVLEQPNEDQPPGSIGQLPMLHTRRHGRTRITLYAAPGPF